MTAALIGELICRVFKIGEGAVWILLGAGSTGFGLGEMVEAQRSEKVLGRGVGVVEAGGCLCKGSSTGGVGSR
jgi:hypothetical protein